MTGEASASARGSSAAAPALLRFGLVLALALLGALAISSSAQAAFPGQNGEIAFATGGDIWAINPDGTGQVNITQSPLSSEGQPTFSPDGKRIAYDRDNLDGNVEIYVMNADGSNVVQISNVSPSDIVLGLVRSGEDPNSHRLAFSADGNSIFFDAVDAIKGNSNIYRINLDGSGLVNLTQSDSSDNYHPDLSPDGQRITFWTNRDLHREIYVMNTDGSNQVRLTKGQPTGEPNAWNPAFSPDGTQIVFERELDFALDLWTMTASGAGQSNLTNVGANGNDYDATWQPIPVTPTPTPPPSLLPSPMAPPPGVVADTVPPTVTRYRVSNGTFVVGRAPTAPVGVSAATRHNQGTSFLYSLSEPATVRIVISRLGSGRRSGSRCVAPSRVPRGARCTRVSPQGTLTRISHKGANRVAFSGRIGARALSPGRYQATLTATDNAHNTAKARTVAFTIVEH